VFFIVHPRAMRMASSQRRSRRHLGIAGNMMPRYSACPKCSTGAASPAELHGHVARPLHAGWTSLPPRRSAADDVVEPYVIERSRGNTDCRGIGEMS